MNFKHLSIVLLSLASSPAFATDATQANALFKELGQEIQRVLDLREIAENEVGAWYTSADSTAAATYCDTGYFGRGTLKIGVPFKIGRQSACVKTYRKMGSELESMTGSRSWEYLNRAYVLPELAEKTLSELGVISVRDSEQAKCLQKLRKLTDAMAELSEYYLDPMGDHQIGQKMNTIQALEFMKLVTKDGRKPGDYLELENATRKDLIARGREIHLAVQVLRMSLYNQATPEYSKFAAHQLVQGCGR